ncbi:MAG: (2Fe-2S)-binding protein [Chloroflexi bacterium]|nr:(2Fe-2S)-binding protein [Chloroflexota bacterium]
MVEVELDGQRISVTEGRSIAAALLEAGVPALRYSHFLSQPRGLFCGDGRCGECRMTVDGVPGVRTCLVPARAGQRINTGGVDESALESIGERAPE